jgi:hypothetical protein
MSFGRRFARHRRLPVVELGSDRDALLIAIQDLLVSWGLCGGDEDRHR